MFLAFFRYVVFAMHVDIYTMSRYMLKAMYRKTKTSYNLEHKDYYLFITFVKLLII
jgi:hypothetical protein